MFLVFFCAVTGFTQIMVDSSIMDPLRKWLKPRLPASMYKAFECYQCMGFWTGLICGLFLISFNPFVILCCGFAGSFVSTFSVTYLNYLEAQTIVNLEDDEQS